MRVPVIKTASDTPGPTRDRIWDKLKTKAERDYLIKLMVQRGNHSWNPGEEIIIESSKEIQRIMQTNSDYKTT